MKKIILSIWIISSFIILLYFCLKIVLWGYKQDTIINTYCDRIIKTEYITGSFWQRGKTILFFKNGKREYFNSNTKIPKDNICIVTLFDGRKIIK